MIFVARSIQTYVCLKEKMFLKIISNRMKAGMFAKIQRAFMYAIAR